MPPFYPHSTSKDLHSRCSRSSRQPEFPPATLHNVRQPYRSQSELSRQQLTSKPTLPGIGHVFAQISTPDFLNTEYRGDNEHRADISYRGISDEKKTLIPIPYDVYSYDEQSFSRHTSFRDLICGFTSGDVSHRDVLPSIGGSQSDYFILSSISDSTSTLPDVPSEGKIKDGRTFSTPVRSHYTRSSTDLTSKAKHNLHNQDYREDQNKFLSKAQNFLMHIFGWVGEKEQSGLKKGGSKANAAKSGLRYEKGSILVATIQAIQYAELLSLNFVDEALMGGVWPRFEGFDWEEFENDKVAGQLAICTALVPLAHERGRDYLEEEIARLHFHLGQMHATE